LGSEGRDGAPCSHRGRCGHGGGKENSTRLLFVRGSCSGSARVWGWRGRVCWSNLKGECGEQEGEPEADRMAKETGCSHTKGGQGILGTRRANGRERTGSRTRWGWGERVSPQGPDGSLVTRRYPVRLLFEYHAPSGLSCARRVGALTHEGQTGDRGNHGF